jgi:hypothetical protein
LLWCCRKRAMRPQAAYYKYYPESEWALFDAAGPERDDPDGRRGHGKGCRYEPQTSVEAK